MLAADTVYALLADGATAQIRPAGLSDLDAVRQMHEAMSQDNSYLRFFGLSRMAAGQEARRVCQPPSADRFALLAWLDGELVGVASYELAGRPEVAEIAFAVADHAHGRGVAMLLLEHLVSAANDAGVRTFTAQTLAENSAMLKVFADTGLHASRQLTEGVIELAFDLPRSEADRGWDRYLDAVARRESHADVASLQHLLAAESVAVVSASRRPGSPGRTILHNIISGGYRGRLYSVSQPGDRADGGQADGTRADGGRCLTSVAELPEPVDLAIVAVPAAEVADVAEECGRRGVRSLVVITPALNAAAGAALLGTCRRYGVRLVGPGCIGVAVPGIRLDATLAARHPAPGQAGLGVQSGSAGVGLLEHLCRIGIGVSSFVSLGEKYDVSGNDLLLWWEQDAATKLAVLSLESFGNPRKFFRNARRAGAMMPVLAVHAGRSGAGPAAAGSLVDPEALFAQAGIIATRDIEELAEAAAVLDSQPVPASRRIGVVADTAAAAALAAGACADAGLHVTVLGAGTQDELRRMLPGSADVAGPVNTTALVPPGAFRQCLELVSADEGVDAVLAFTAGPAIAGRVTAACAAEVGKTFALAVLDQAQAVRLLPRTPDGPGRVPAYARPESAARALAHAGRYGEWRARPRGRVPEFGDLRPADARGLIRAFLGRAPGGGWLSGDEARKLLSCYGIPLVHAARGTQAGTAGCAAEGIGGPEVLHADVADLAIRVVQDPVFGPLAVLRPGGAAGASGGHAVRLIPLTDADADELICSVRASPLPGSPATAAADRAALAGVLLRISQLADDIAEVAELDLSPVIAGPDGVFTVSARVRVTIATAADPFLRRLR